MLISLGASASLTFETLDGALRVDADSTSLAATLDGSAWVQIPVDRYGVGLYGADWTPPTAGTWSVRFSSTGAGAGTDSMVVTVTDETALAIITAASLRGYLGDTPETDAGLLGALAAERSAQAARCRVDPYTADLREALLRRVARNLAARAIPISTFSSFGDGGSTSYVPKLDAEIGRLEAPRRRTVVG